MISREKLLDEFFADTPYGCGIVGVKYVDELIQKQPISFNLDRVLEQLEDYGKYKGVLHCDEDKCENFIPVSVAKQIVKGRGIGGILGYMKSDKQATPVYEIDERELDGDIGVSNEFLNDCKRVAKKYKRSKTERNCSTCKNNVEFPPPHTCDICTSLDQEEEYEMWEAK